MKNALITALCTPYLKGEIDKLSYVKLCEYQRANGVDALLALGTTAEAQLLRRSEKKLLVKLAKSAAKDVPLIAGVEMSATSEAVKEAVFLQNEGADALLIAPPSFCKCTAEGYKRHISRILDATSIPLIIYNVPSRAGYALGKDTVLSVDKRVRYIKDADSDTSLAKAVNKRMRVFCGNDELLSDYLTDGASGVISVTSNAAPLLTRKILNGEKNDVFVNFAKLTMKEVNPVPIKYIMYKKGFFSSYEMRLPLTKANCDTQKEIDGFFEKFGDKIY